MKRGFFMIFLMMMVLLWAMPGISSAFQNEPPGFRGIPWGAKVEDVGSKVKFIKVDVNNPNGYETETRESTESGLTLLRSRGDFTEYYRKDEPLTFGDANIDSVTYCFYKNRFYKVAITYTDMWNYEAIKKRLFAVYGPGEKPKTEHRTYWWFGQDMTIGLEYLIFTRGGNLNYLYTPISRDKEQDEVKAARKGTTDF